MGCEPRAPDDPEDYRAIGNLAGFAGPYVMGWTRDTTGTYVAGLLPLSAACLLSVAIVVTLRDEEATETRQTAAV
jgi:nitrate/nitrite transporter NarK